MTQASKSAEKSKHRQRLWNLLRDRISCEHRALEVTNPTSPRIRPGVGVVGFILVGGAK
jgi:hypothetical protein